MHYYPGTKLLNNSAASIVESLGSYTEISTSGTGMHVLMTGELPSDRNRSGNLEIYETARFFTVTGEHYVDLPTELRERIWALETITAEFLASDESTPSNASDSASPASKGSLDEDELLRRAQNAANGEKFARLWRGDTSGFESHSGADMALCAQLAFRTSGDPRQVDRLFRDSGLMREKWDETHFADGSTHGEKTVERAISVTDEIYEPPSGEGDDREEAWSSRDTDGSQRGSRRVNRIEELRQRLTVVLEENERLQQQLETERAKREELEAELEAERTGDRSLISWW